MSEPDALQAYTQMQEYIGRLEEKVKNLTAQLDAAKKVSVAFLEVSAQDVGQAISETCSEHNRVIDLEEKVADLTAKLTQAEAEGAEHDRQVELLALQRAITDSDPGYICKRIGALAAGKEPKP